MEDFEKKAIEQATHKPVCWFRYVDDMFVIWPHGKEKLTEFHSHLNRVHGKIQFTMEKEEGHLAFLDLDIYRRTDGSLGHKIYRKPTHTNLYLHQNSHHHPANIQSSLPWYTEPKLSAMKIPSTKKQNFSPPSSRTIDTALNRYEP